ncbi:EamA family transporter [Salinicola endophyticus]|uniref:EamA family transporter n=1 Tax=Salinicola endophyticus TaxID=1949083 RepID=UPI000DA204F1|nr:EamA family transporter [Salinicola endophyticus]
MREAWTLAGAALAPAIWGSTYLVTTELLPPGFPLMAGVLRALPAGLLLLLCVRRLPPWSWVGRLLLLGGLNFAVFWALLFVAAYRLPGGIAATLGATQPLMVLVLSQWLLGAPWRGASVIAALAGLFGVALLLIEPDMQLDSTGVVAALGAAGSMALGSVLTKRWRPPVSALTFTAWQLVAGGLLLLPVALLLEPGFPAPSWRNVAGYLWLGGAGAALTYWLWFRGIETFGPARVSALGFLSPLSAVLLGWLWLDQSLSALQLFGTGVVLLSVWGSQRVARSARASQGESGGSRA